MKSYLRRTWAEVNLDALKHNFNAIRKATDRNARLICVIKADAYGHGAVTLGRLYEELGADGFAVSNIEEAIQLREGGITLPVLILGFTPADLAGELAKHHISQAVFSEEYARELSAEAVRQDVTVNIHLKVDTGMSRIGFVYQLPERDEPSIRQMEQVCVLPNLVPEGIFTHFALADEPEEGRIATRNQLSAFTEAVQRLQADGYSFSLVHCANSGAIICHREAPGNAVRAGIILYGLSPSGTLKGCLDLQPAMTIKSVIAQVKTVEPHTPVSYGCTYWTEKPTKIATVPIGYADGYPRSLSNRAYMTVGGQKAPVIGRVCMDQLMLDVSDIDTVAPGDEVTVIGDGTDGSMTFDDAAAIVGTINYELVCMIGKRVPRVYLHHNKTVEVMDSLTVSKEAQNETTGN